MVCRIDLEKDVIALIGGLGGKKLASGPTELNLVDYDPTQECLSSVTLVYPSTVIAEILTYAAISTRVHDTTINIEHQKPRGRWLDDSASGIIFDSTYGYGKPSPAAVRTIDGKLIATVTHIENAAAIKAFNAKK